MAHPIDTLGKAVRRGMLVRSECLRCGNVRLYRASDLMMVFGGGLDPITLKFRCGKRLPDVKVTLVDADLDRARDAIVYEPFFYQGKLATWLPKRLR